MVKAVPEGTFNKPGGSKTKGENNERYFNEAAAGSRRAFWTPDQKMEP